MPLSCSVIARLIVFLVLSPGARRPGKLARGRWDGYTTGERGTGGPSHLRARAQRSAVHARARPRAGCGPGIQPRPGRSRPGPRNWPGPKPPPGPAPALGPASAGAEGAQSGTMWLPAPRQPRGVSALPLTTGHPYIPIALEKNACVLALERLARWQAGEDSGDTSAAVAPREATGIELQFRERVRQVPSKTPQHPPRRRQDPPRPQDEPKKPMPQIIEIKNL